MRFLLCLLIGLVFSFLLGAVARAESRLAFVVGVDAYTQLPPASQLQRAVADAEAVSSALEGLGFEVTRASGAASTTSLAGLLKSFADFKASVRDGDTALLFFAGHGLGLSDGSYLLPSDVNPSALEADYSARRAMIREGEWTTDLQRSGARVVIVVIDACRNDIFSRGLTRAVGIERGLAPTATEGVFKLYSASEGQSAMDRLPGVDQSKNSVFTRVLLKALNDPKLDLNRLGAFVRDEVFELAKGAHHVQTPEVYDRLVGSSRVFLARQSGTAAGFASALDTSAGPIGAGNVPSAVPMSAPRKPAPEATDLNSTSRPVAQFSGALKPTYQIPAELLPPPTAEFPSLPFATVPESASSPRPRRLNLE